MCVQAIWDEEIIKNRFASEKNIKTFWLTTSKRRCLRKSAKALAKRGKKLGAACQRPKAKSQSKSGEGWGEVFPLAPPLGNLSNQKWTKMYQWNIWKMCHKTIIFACWEKSTTSSQRTVFEKLFLFWYYVSEIGCISGIKIKILRLLFWIPLDLHYLWSVISMTRHIEKSNQTSLVWESAKFNVTRWKSEAASPMVDIQHHSRYREWCVLHIPMGVSWFHSFCYG